MYITLFSSCRSEKGILQNPKVRMTWYPIVNQYSIFNFCVKNQNYAIKGPVREYSCSCADFVTYYKNMSLGLSDTSFQIVWQVSSPIDRTEPKSHTPFCYWYNFDLTRSPTRMNK